MFRCLIIIFTLLLGSCASLDQPQSKMLVLSYDQFGPQAAAYEVIGMNWWQWQNAEHSQSKKHDIRIVIYKDISIKEVAKRFPVIPTQEKDFRYLKYSKALSYLDRHIEENFINSLTKKFITTRGIISDFFR